MCTNNKPHLKNVADGSEKDPTWGILQIRSTQILGSLSVPAKSEGRASCPSCKNYHLALAKKAGDKLSSCHLWFFFFFS
jgi:hypothetical protein